MNTIASASYWPPWRLCYSSVGLLPFLSRDSAKHKLVWLCTRCSLGWRVHPKMTALDAFGCKNTKIQQNSQFFLGWNWLKRQKRYEKVWWFVKICIILPSFSNLCKVNKEQCCNKEWTFSSSHANKEMLASTLSWRENVERSSTYQHCYRSRAKKALEASAMFIRQTRWVLQHVTGTRQISNEHHQIENLTGWHRCSRPSEHRR